jgi:hypothetical protein
MLADEGARLAAELAWLESRTDHLVRADALLERAFIGLAELAS